MTKLSFAQIDDAMHLEDHTHWMVEVGMEEEELQPLDHEMDETAYRTSYQRKEIRTKRKREDGELVGSGDIRKHRKY